MAELRNRPKMERDFMRRLSTLSRAERDEVEDLLGTPPDPANIPASFWAKVKKRREDEIAVMLLLLFMLGSRQHGGTPAGEATLYADGRAGEVASSYVERSREMLRTAGEEWAEKPPNKGELRARLRTVFGEARDEAIAVTETTAAQSAGGETAVRSQGLISPDDVWRTERDARVCPICSPLDGAQRETWTAKFPKGPPAHPRCRCVIIYADVVGNSPTEE